MRRVGYWRGSPPLASRSRGRDRRSRRADRGARGAPLRALRRLRLPVRAPVGAARPLRCGARAGCRCGSSGCARGSSPLAARCSCSPAAPGSRPPRPSRATAPGCSTPRTGAATRSSSTSAAPGSPGALRCRSLEEANLLDATTAAARCATSLGPRRAFYTSADTVEDMEAIRRELGVERIAHLRNLVRHQGGAGIRAPLSGAGGAARARLGGGGGRPRPALPRHLRRHAAGAAARSAAPPAGPSRAIRWPISAGSWHA